MPRSVEEQREHEDILARLVKLEVEAGFREAPPPPLTPEQVEAKHAAEVLSGLGPESRALLAKILANN